ncbi:unnamed protein product, partial [marine sediment metagenome]
EHYLGQTVYDVFPKEVADMFIERFNRIIKSGVEETIEERVELLDKYISSSLQPVRDLSSDKVLGVQIIARDITERRQTQKVQEALYKISEAINLTRDLEGLFRSIHEIIAELMYAKNLYIALYDLADETISFPYFVDELEESLPPRKKGKGLTEYVIRTGKPLLAPFEVFKKLEKKGEVELIGDPWVDWLGVPLKIQEKTIGVMTVQNYSEDIRYSEKDKDILSFVSTQVAMAIERKQAEEQLKALNEELEATNEELIST